MVNTSSFTFYFIEDEKLKEGLSIMLQYT